MAGYSRNDTANNIADGNIINASDLDGEFDAIQTAFDDTTGHSHDGTTGEGAPIESVGPAQDAVITATEIKPKTDNTLDLGTSTLEFKDLYIDGTAHIDTLDIDENATITGTLGVTGATTLSSTLGVTGLTTLTGDVKVDTIDEVTAAGGVTVDGVLLKDSQVSTDTINELTAAAGVTIDGVVLKDGGATVTADVNFGDDDKAIFGAGSDLQIYHDGSTGHSHITEVGTGSLIIKGTNIALQNGAGTENLLAANTNGSVDLYYDASKKLATTSTGIDVTGEITADGIALGDAEIIKLGDSNEFQIYHSAGGNSVISETGGGSLYIDGTNIYLRNGTATGETYLSAISDGAVSLYHNNSQKLATTSTGIDVTGTVTADGLTVDGNPTLNNTGDSLLNFTAFDGSQNTTAQIMVTRQDLSTSKSVFRIYNNNGSGLIRALETTGDNDISFYEDTGTTAKFFWDASAESLGIGTSSPQNNLTVEATDAEIGIRGGINLNDTSSLILSNNRSAIKSEITNGSNGDTSIYFMNRQGGVSQTEAMRIDSSGNVGIGTSSPTTQLTLEASNSGATNNNTLRFVDSDTTSAANQSFGKIEFETKDTGGAGVNAFINGFSEGTGGQGALSFGTGANGSSERMRITSSGNVVIGASSTNGTGKLQVTDAVNYTFEVKSGGSGIVTLGGTSGTNNMAFQTNGSERMRIDSSGNLLLGTTGANGRFTLGGSVTSTNLCRIGNIDYGTDTVLSVAPGVVNFDAPGVVGGRMRIASNGYVSIGQTTSPDAPLNIRDSGSKAISFYYSVNKVGSITCNASSTSYNTSSDYRLKEDWQPMSGSIDRVKALNPVNFAWKEDGTRVDGFLAHEAQEVVPEAVNGTKDAVTAYGNITDAEGTVVQEDVVEPETLKEGQIWTKVEDKPDYQGIDQSKLVPLLTSALQEAIARIETLEAEVTALKGA